VAKSKSARRWLDAIWSPVRTRLPPPPARVVEIGCGSLGGFVPALRADGFEALGVDPQAPEGPEYRRVPFEHVELKDQVDVVIASTSLHHVDDPDEVVARIASTLVPGGRIVVVEWAWEEFDEPTARWCFERLGPDDEPGWLHRRRDEWRASGRSWSESFQDWARQERLHAARDLLARLEDRFRREHLARGPYFFVELAGTTERDELAAIEAGRIRAARVDYVGSLK